MMFAHKPPTGTWEILLGEPRRPSLTERGLRLLGRECGPGYWGVPGGPVKPGDKGFLDTATRETLFACWRDNLDVFPPFDRVFKKKVAQLLPDGGGEISPEPHVFRTPFFMEYHTFLVRLSRLPERDVWPKPDPAAYVALEWFPLNVLPKRTHFLAQQALFSFRRRGLLV